MESFAYRLGAELIKKADDSLPAPTMEDLVAREDLPDHVRAALQRSMAHRDRSSWNPANLLYIGPQKTTDDITVSKWMQPGFADKSRDAAMAATDKKYRSYMRSHPTMRPKELWMTSESDEDYAREYADAKKYYEMAAKHPEWAKKNPAPSYEFAGMADPMMLKQLYPVKPGTPASEAYANLGQPKMPKSRYYNQMTGEFIPEPMTPRQQAGQDSLASLTNPASSSEAAAANRHRARMGQAEVPFEASGQMAVAQPRQPRPGPSMVARQHSQPTQTPGAAALATRKVGR